MTRNSRPAPYRPASAPYFDLGNFHRAITTNSPSAQIWFDRGLVWCYGFNRPEAVACFKRAIAADADCAMAYWGLAYASGPYYNQNWKHFQENELRATLATTHRAVQDAAASARRSSKVTPVEIALIHALQTRHPSDQPPQDFSIWDQNYANAMQSVYETYGIASDGKGGGNANGDLDVTALYADALMVLTPWALWDPHTGKPSPGARTLDAKAVIEHALSKEIAYDHPGLLHLYVHLMEMSREPEIVLRAADRLRYLIPEAGHLNHMPSHIDVLVGDYRRAMEANINAVRSDDLYAKRVTPFGGYTMYRAHDYHSLIYAATLAARSAEAIKYSSLLEDALPPEFMRHPPSNADWTESFHGVRPHVLIRFGLWDEILKLPMPTDPHLFCYTTATYHYAKGIAHAAKGQIPQAEKEQRRFHDAAKRVPESRFDFPNRCVDILPVANAMLAGEIEYRKCVTPDVEGDLELAFHHLRTAIRLDDGLGYSEPWSWMIPTRHAYGALLMDQGRYEEACPVYEADLGLDRSLPRGHQHPNNVWALVGYSECLSRLGREREAKLLDLPLRQARQLADVDVRESCACKIRRAKVEGGGCCGGVRDVTEPTPLGGKQRVEILNKL